MIACSSCTITEKLQACYFQLAEAWSCMRIYTLEHSFPPILSVEQRFLKTIGVLALCVRLTVRWQKMGSDTQAVDNATESMEKLRQKLKKSTDGRPCAGSRLQSRKNVYLLRHLKGRSADQRTCISPLSSTTTSTNQPTTPI